jgi:hypothetical protein
VGATPTYALPYPEPGDPADVPTDLHELCDRIEAVLVPGAASGQIPIWDNAGKRWTPGYPLFAIADVVLGSSSASIDIQNIPQTFRHLLVVVFARCDGSGAAQNLTARYNGDSTANYDSQFLTASATTVAGAEILASTSMRWGQVPAATAPAGSFSGGTIWIPNYADAGNMQPAQTHFGNKQGNAGGLHALELGMAFYRLAAAVSRITILPGGGSLIANSRVTLYGVP